MPGPHMPPAIPMHPHRRQSDYHYQYQQQSHSPMPPNMYAGYPPAPYLGQPHPYAQPQWYAPYQQQHQYTMPPRQYQPQPQPHGGPVVVSSHPHLHSPSLNRGMMSTPPVAPSYTPPTIQQASQPPPPATPTPQTPSVSSQAPASPPTPTTETTTATTPPPPPDSSSGSVTTPSQSTAQPNTQTPSPSVEGRRMPFQAPLPWYSNKGEQFPSRAPRRRLRRDVVPITEQIKISSLSSGERIVSTATPAQGQDAVHTDAVPEQDAHQTLSIETISQTESIAPSTPPSSATAPESDKTPTVKSHTRSSTIPAVPIVPLRPAVPQSQKSPRPNVNGNATDSSTEPTTDFAASQSTVVGSEQAATVSSPPAAPKSWAELVRLKNPAAAVQASPAAANGASGSNGFPINKNATISDVLTAYTVESDNKVAFLEPRGLVNTGNMCYMNSILQALVFCVPFYDFIDQVGKRAAHSFKSDTPLIDAMIMFLREYQVIDSATSVEQLRMRLKDTELEQYGEAFTPEYVYEVIRRLASFAHMPRGHQQDAEEFLGFLLTGLHDEIAQVMGRLPANGEAVDTNVSSPPSTSSTDAGWLEVGPKQKSAVTRSSGSIDLDSPITKIFGGKLRSELRVPGAKTSVTLEPYQPLQLDIGAPHVGNIVDALRSLTQPETLHGDFSSPRGPGKSATKQVFIDSLPPVLILHLKRFQYDNAGGTQKIWKKVGYPLELEVPKEVFPPSKRAGLAAHGGPPKYRLISVVYHHGKNASGGHYTVDVRRQEGREWIRIDDTIIRRIRSDDVAEGGSEEDPKLLATALEQHKRDQSRHRNLFEGLGEEQERAEEGGWKDANAQPGRKWTGVANGTATPSTTGKHTPKDKSGYKDNKVAYILFYQQIKS
ncbi:cysteine proteinase [Pseudovirgaria hyperparasitica]|uniref:Ubiquitin carboxyl-terminal hydrolase n=1 Tax=Pseudovirgaria hyperparasitica TaxID=470096 RepID=A0A6A6W5Z5_9PEZI|nr:cysteine proteinase [Pseudovirgaria hyperparasitica]KAF2757370.1 cysteine proteinase [Pseudovirgaria hyperparasitica]